MTDTDPNIDELRALVARMERTLAPDQFVATDAYGNPGAVAAGELIESSWGNAVVDRITKVYPTVAAMDAAGGAQGAIAYVTATGVQYRRNALGWGRITPLAGIVAGPGGNYVAGQIMSVAVPNDAGHRTMSIVFNAFAANHGATAMDLQFKVDGGSPVAQYRHPAVGGTQAMINFAYHNIGLTAGAAHTVSLWATQTIGLQADPTFNSIAYLIVPA